jgi:hypothetical protein
LRQQQRKQSGLFDAASNTHLDNLSWQPMLGSTCRECRIVHVGIRWQGGGLREVADPSNPASQTGKIVKYRLETLSINVVVVAHCFAKNLDGCK